MPFAGSAKTQRDQCKKENIFVVAEPRGSSLVAISSNLERPANLPPAVWVYRPSHVSFRCPLALVSNIAGGDPRTTSTKVRTPEGEKEKSEMMARSGRDRGSHWQKLPSAFPIGNGDGGGGRTTRRGSKCAARPYHQSPWYVRKHGIVATGEILKRLRLYSVYSHVSLSLS